MPSDKKKTILIIEDERPMSDALKMALSKEHHVLTAYDGEEGYQTALEKKPNLILLDINMPKMNGIETLKKIKEDPWGKEEADIIMLSNMNDPLFVADAAKYGVFDFLVKTDWKLSDVAKVVREKLAKQPEPLEE